MALDDEALESLLRDATLENTPAQMRGAGLTGPRVVVSEAEQRDRRETLAQLLAAGMSRDFMIKTMTATTKPDGSPGFGMTKEAVTLLVAEVYQTWREEDTEDRPHKKAGAVRRIKRNIARAAAKNNYAAVAQLERTLMMIEGTAEPIEVNVNGLERVSVAVQKVLNVQTADALDELIAEEKKYIEAHGVSTTLLPPGDDDALEGEVVDAFGE